MYMHVFYTILRVIATPDSVWMLIVVGVGSSKVGLALEFSARYALQPHHTKIPRSAAPGQTNVSDIFND